MRSHEATRIGLRRPTLSILPRVLIGMGRVPGSAFHRSFFLIGPLHSSVTPPVTCGIAQPQSVHAQLSYSVLCETEIVSVFSARLYTSFHGTVRAPSLFCHCRCSVSSPPRFILQTFALLHSPLIFHVSGSPCPPLSSNREFASLRTSTMLHHNISRFLASSSILSDFINKDAVDFRYHSFLFFSNLLIVFPGTVVPLLPLTWHQNLQRRRFVNQTCAKLLDATPLYLKTTGALYSQRVRARKQGPCFQNTASKASAASIMAV